MDSPKTPVWTTVSPHDAFAAPLARPHRNPNLRTEKLMAISIAPREVQQHSRSPTATVLVVLPGTTLVSQCSATVRHCSCYTRCSATPFYDIDMANLRCYTPSPKRTEAVATVPFLRPFQGCSATVVRHCASTRPQMLHKCSISAVARHPWCSV